MDDTDDRRHAREPQVEDLARICRSLNDEGARYVIDLMAVACGIDFAYFTASLALSTASSIFSPAFSLSLIHI